MVSSLIDEEHVKFLLNTYSVWQILHIPDKFTQVGEEIMVILQMIWIQDRPIESLYLLVRIDSQIQENQLITKKRNLCSVSISFL